MEDVHDILQDEKGSCAEVCAHKCVYQVHLHIEHVRPGNVEAAGEFGLDECRSRC